MPVTSKASEPRSPRLSRPIAIGAVLAAALSCGACTLLATFVDEPLTDAGLDVDAGPPAVDGAVSVDSAPGAETGAAHDSGGPYEPCKGLLGHSYCATDGLLGYRGSPSDLVRCDGDGGVLLITTCDGGCLTLSSPFPDTCNGCNTKTDGLYCGRDFPIFPASDGDWLIQCQKGNASQQVECAHGCLSSGSASRCAP